jgi:hypothetical protein
MKLFHIINMNIYFICILLIYVCMFQCVGEFFFYLYRNFYKKFKKLTDTLKLIHRNEPNTNETLYIDVLAQ